MRGLVADVCQRPPPASCCTCHPQQGAGLAGCVSPQVAPLKLDDWPQCSFKHSLAANSSMVKRQTVKLCHSSALTALPARLLLLGAWRLAELSVLCSHPAALWSFPRAGVLPLWQQAPKCDSCCRFQSTEAQGIWWATTLLNRVAGEHAFKPPHRGAFIFKDIALMCMLCREPQAHGGTWKCTSSTHVPTCRHAPQG